MIRLPSRKLREATSMMVGEADYIAGVKRDLAVSKAVSDGMDGVFGAAVYNALEELERSCYASMANTSPYRVFKQVRIRAELTVAQYIKSRLNNYVTNAETLMQNMAVLNGEQDNDY